MLERASSKCQEERGTWARFSQRTGPATAGKQDAGHGVHTRIANYKENEEGPTATSLAPGFVEDPLG